MILSMKSNQLVSVLFHAPVLLFCNSNEFTTPCVLDGLWASQGYAHVWLQWVASCVKNVWLNFRFSYGVMYYSGLAMGLKLLLPRIFFFFFCIFCVSKSWCKYFSLLKEMGFNSVMCLATKVPGTFQSWCCWITAAIFLQQLGGAAEPDSLPGPILEFSPQSFAINENKKIKRMKINQTKKKDLTPPKGLKDLS